MTSCSPNSRYKIITKQIFIPQETLHRVLIYLFVDPKTKAATKKPVNAVKVLPGFGRRNIFTTGELTGDLKWGKPSTAPSAPSSLRGPFKHPGNSSCNVSIKRRRVSADFWKPRSNVLSKWRWIASAASPDWEVDRLQSGCRRKVKYSFKL